MRVAFYAPLKSPDAPTPSGDRRMARLLMSALRLGGHEVRLASRLRSRDGAGDPDLQERLAARGMRYADRLIGCCEKGTIPRPDLWFTYHLYYKAPDLIGPEVARRLGIPYVVAEASNAPKRASGPWASAHERVIAALGRADLVVGFNSRDKACLLPCLREGAAYLDLKPFLDEAPSPEVPGPDAPDTGTQGAAADWRAELGLAVEMPLLLAVGMMRPGDKVASYRTLAEALSLLPGDRNWALAIVGDGTARNEVETLFAAFGPRVHFLGALAPERLRQVYNGSDIFVWPAINEAYGMALLEAQAAGLPVVAGDAGGVPDIVSDGVTGLLSPEGDAAAFAASLEHLLSDSARAGAMGTRARLQVARMHSLEQAAGQLDRALAGLVGTPGRGG